MSELKLRRLTEHNQRLREDLARPRIRVSEASARCLSHDSLRRPTLLTNDLFIFLFVTATNLPLVVLDILGAFIFIPVAAFSLVMDV